MNKKIKKNISGCWKTLNSFSINKDNDKDLKIENDNFIKLFLILKSYKKNIRVMMEILKNVSFSKI